MEDPKTLEEGRGNGTANGHQLEPVAEDVDGEKSKTASEEQPLRKGKTKRVATLDAFRGLTIVLMILVDDAGGAYPWIDHSPWNGCTLADFVLPFFLFIVGVAIALALKRISEVKYAVKKIILRTLKLIFWGILLQGGYSHAPYELTYGVDMKKIRWCGILQRIALVYFVVALIETLTSKARPNSLKPGHFSIFAAYKWQWVGGIVAFTIYMITTYSLYVPDWSFVASEEDGRSETYTVKCGMRGHLGPACNAVGYVDRQFWGINHLYTQPVWARLRACTFSSPDSGPFREDAPTWCRAPFEPEGLLSSISAIVTGTIGIHYGHVLIHFKIDVYGLRTPFLFLEWIGMNAMLVFVLAAQGIFAAFVNGWYFKNPDRNLVKWIMQHVFVDVWNSERVGTILYVIFAEITFCYKLARQKL
ncbi:hypothetical protein SASPL_155187 [Salvia splendens]|uniref:Heparan-alpha-glucosaminide N-acetyltransferase catalytic domain-containing protein n=1 Tax=Salvia splendens TaxID=180675 RepID=A0A8X8YZ42_SALSN|nr:hypothetical protein SASPL_155187 [Salvia splendens]